VVGCTSGVGLLPVALGPSFLDKGVGTGPTATQVGPACAQIKLGLPRTCLRQTELFQISCGRHNNNNNNNNNNNQISGYSVGNDQTTLKHNYNNNNHFYRRKRTEQK